MSKQELGRVLTLAELRMLGACARGRSVFRKTWGTQAIINEAWARQAGKAARLVSGDASWLADRFLPHSWYSIYNRARDPYINAPWRVWQMVSFAVFAALYVEAGEL